MGANYFLDNDDLRFNFENSVNWKDIVELTEAGYTQPGGHGNLEEAKEFYRAVMESVGEFAGDVMAPRLPAIDHEGTKLVNGEAVFGKALTEVMAGLKERELFGMPVPRELGGSNCPMAVFFATGEVIARADVSVMTHFSFHGGMAMVMLMYGAKEGNVEYGNSAIKKARWESAIREIAAGEAWGSMDLTEPGAGSDLGAIRTKAERRGDKWILNGEKIFITSGHAKYHFVLAKTDKSSSSDSFDALKQLGLFMVPRYIERDGETVPNCIVTKVEEKIGHHGSATCALSYEDSEGELVGHPTQGFELMLMLMNNARVGVGFESLGICEAATRMAHAYAADRKTMGQTINRHPMIAEMLMDMQLDTSAIRALAFEAVNHVELSAKLEFKLSVDPPAGEESIRALKKRLSLHRRRARELTPLLKLISSEASVRLARTNMQIHGGLGYSSEIGAEKLLRDALVLPIYEGTTQIQALMAFKDQLTFALRSPGAFARHAGQAHLQATASSAEIDRIFHKAEASLYQAIFAIVARIASTKLRKTVADKGWSEVSDFVKASAWDSKSDFAEGLLHAERFARASAEVECARALRAQAAAHPERKKLSDRYTRRMSGRVANWVNEILANDRSVFEWLSELGT